MELQSNLLLIDILKSFTVFQNIPIDEVEFYLSMYKNGRPGSGITESRRILKIKGISKNVVFDLLNELPQDFELAIHSKIKIGGKKFHLPFIDFSYEYYDDFFLDAIDIIKNRYGGSVYIFNSGRSFHGYHDLILTEIQWKKYLGSLLLLNDSNQEYLFVDSRWIGHSLLKGYSSLRISKLTDSYLKSPLFMKKI